eukprot:gene7801-10596_t
MFRLRNLATQPIRQIRRSMGGHSHAAPKEGIDAVVHKYLPKSYHIVAFVFGFYFSLYGLYKISSSFSKKPAVKAAAEASVVASDGAIPSIDSPEFEAWIEVPGNFEKLFA